MDSNLAAMPDRSEKPGQPLAGEHPLTTFRRKNNDMRMAELARRAGVTTSTISRIEAGTLKPSLAMTRKLLKAAGNKIKADAIIQWSPPGDADRSAGA
jgi:transcriptional regulator with XRE-family HTH domain